MFSAKHPKKSVGQFGEDLAFKYLINKGWDLIIRNYRRKSDEIDIIGKSPDNTLVFVEVKTLLKKSLNNGLTPEDNLSINKYRKISRAAQFFSREYPQYVDPDLGWRIDLVAIQIDEVGRKAQIRHYQNI